MHHGSGPQNVQLQRSRSFTGSEGEDQQSHSNLPQSPAAPFAPSASPSAPQSPSYQIQQLMNRSPVAGQNVNITLQNVGPVVGGNQQITLTPLPIPNPTSPGFQFNSQQRRFEHGSPSYIQVTSPLPQQVQSQSPTQPTPGPVQALQSVRAGTPGPGLGICSSSPTGGFVDASVLVRQISLSPSNGGHFVYQEGSGIAQIAQGGQVQLQHAGAPITVRERRLSQPHAQTGGTIHHLGPQSPVASGASMQPLTSPSHIATTSLPPQISSIIQGQLIQQQQVLQGQQLNRPVGFERPSGVLISGVGGSSAFGMTSPPPGPTSPSRAAVPQGLSSLPLTPAGSIGVKKVPKKLEEIPPASQETAQMRKQCLDHHYREMEALKENFKEYLIELFFLQHLQGNMMDFLAFKKKLYGPLHTYLKQNDLDFEEEEEEQSEVINDEVKVVTGKDGQTGTPVAIATQLPPNVSAAFSSQQPFQQMHTGSPVTGTVTTLEIETFKRQQTMTQTDSPKRPRIDVGCHGAAFQCPAVTSGVPLQQLMPTAQGGMPPTPQTVQLTGQKQNQQQYDPSKGPPVQNAASLHTPPPQLPGRLQPANVPGTSLSSALQILQQPQQQMMETQSQPQPPILVKTQPPNVPIPAAPASQPTAPLPQPLTPALHVQMQGQPPAQISQSQATVQQQTVSLLRPSVDLAQASQHLLADSLLFSSLPPSASSGAALPSVYPLQTNRTSPETKSLSPVVSKPLGLAVATAPTIQSPAQNAVGLPPESSQDKLAEQIKLENNTHQRIAELRKEGLWSLRRLPKLQEALRPKSHWDYLLEEMQWMATDFAQERRWKMAAAKKMIRTVARYHEEKKLNEMRNKKEEQNKLRRIAASIAREIEYFWSNIEQVVEIKLHIEFQEKQKQALNIKKYSRQGKDLKPLQASVKIENESSMASPPGKKRKASPSLTDEEVDDEETIEEQESKEANVNHQAELCRLVREAELPLDDLVKLYEGAFVGSFKWPQSVCDSEETTSEEDLEETTNAREKEEVVVIDSLLSVGQCRGVERTSPGKKHTRDIAEVVAAAETLLPKGSARITTAVKFTTPCLLYGVLREYQKIGLDWLAKLYRKNLNGILADDAGLGKTVQVIAFFAHLACNEGNWGPHLIVVRSCHILKWELELKRWCPGLKILLYFGGQRELRAKRQEWTEPNSFNVCITSYKHFFKGHQAFAKVRWKYLVVDEMQQIRNMTEKHWEALFSLRSQHRLLLIDTPLHNTLMELWTMVHFLIPGISRPYLDFPVKAASEENQDYCHKLVIRLHRMIQPFILRRSKRDVEKQLSKKYEHVLKCRLSNRQKALYDDVILQPGTQEALKSGQFVSVLHVLMKLQRICNHPDLIDPRLSGASYVLEALEFRTAAAIVQALERGLWKDTDMSIFDLIGVENKMTHYEAQVLPKQKISRKLMEEIYTSPVPQSRPRPVKIKPNRLFQPVQYGQKPEGKTVVFPSPQIQRTLITATGAQSGQGRGRSPIVDQAAAAQFQTSQAPTGAPRHQPAATFTTATSTANPVRQRGQNSAQASQLGQTQPQPQAPSHTVQQSVLPQRLVLTSQAQARLPSGEVMKGAQQASLTATQNRIAQPETPVTLQFQGNKFTLSHSQLCQLTAGQPLQLQGNVLQIVSAPGQQYLRPQASLVMQPVSQAGTGQNALSTLGNHHQGKMLGSAAASPQVGVSTRTTVVNLPSGEQRIISKSTGTQTQISLAEKSRLLKERLDRIFSGNERRCSRAPVYGKDVLGICSLFGERKASQPYYPGDKWKWAGLMNCCPSSCTPESSADPLQYLRLTSHQQNESLQDAVKRVLRVLPAVIAAPPHLCTSNPSPSYSQKMNLFRHNLKLELAPYLHQLQQIAAPHSLEFPDLRLVQCDSGKLEALAVLLQRLKSEGRRVLILSQMILMLDILELFLNFHFLTFIRIDEYASYEQRQELMKSFNRDKRIFCAILSTHSRSTGVNLVEADTVVFYDNDLNPVMDAKAQEWCDRIGRCKDIHIYRLVSGNSVEEKLLKNGTKDLIREVAAQGNDYTMAFLTQQTIQELFEVHSPMDDTGFRVKAEEFVLLSQEPPVAETIAPKVAKPFIEALNSIEQEDEEEPVKHAEEVRMTDMESLPTTFISDLDDLKCEEEPSQREELFAVVDQLTPIEKYALNYLELFHVSGDESGQRIIERKLKNVKKIWELRHMRELKEKAESMFLEEEEELLTYTREDASNKEYVYEGPDGQTEIMPLWTPPTPPQDDSDIYVDPVMCLMYEATPILESSLPPVYVRKEHRRPKAEPSAVGRKKKQRHGEVVIPPRSLFDRVTPGTSKTRREGKEQRKNVLLKQQTQFARSSPAAVKPTAECGPDSPEWLISEDWALLQAVKQLLELPLNLAIVSPAHTPNWDLVSDVVNSYSRVYRSPKQCRNRYENVIIPREEGKLMFEANPKKKAKNMYKTKNSRPLRTNQVYAQDEGATRMQLYISHFEMAKMIAGKRSPLSKPLLGMNPFQKNPKHASVFAESGINYDKPLPPIQVASLRAERIAKEKKALAEQQRAQQQTGMQQQQQTQQAAGQHQQQPQAPVQLQPQPQPQPQVVQQPSALVQPAAATVATSAVLAGTIKPAGTGTSVQTATVNGNVLVNTVAGVPAATFQPINKRLASPVMPGPLAASGGGTPAPVVHSQPRPAVTPAASAELLSVASTQGVRALTPIPASTVAMTSLTPVQAQTRSLVTQVTQGTATGVQLSSKTITPAHFQLLRQQQVATQEHLIKLQKHKLQLASQPMPQQQPPPGPQTAPAPPPLPPLLPPPAPSPQLTAVQTPRPGAVLAGTAVANLQVTRLTRVATSQLPAPGQTAPAAPAKPPGASSPAVTALAVNRTGIGGAVSQPQKATGPTVVAQPLHVQQLLKLKTHQQQKVIQPQSQTTVQQKISAQQITVQAQQQKVTYAPQPSIKTQFLMTPLSQTPKPTGAHQVPAPLQVAKIPQVVQQQTTVASIQQMVSVSQQVQPQPQTVTTSQTAAGLHQVQGLPATTVAPQTVQQKLVQQQGVSPATPQLQVPPASEGHGQQSKGQMRMSAVRLKALPKSS